jgi:hypothetical protein
MISDGMNGYWTVGKACWMITMVRKVERAMIVPFPSSIIMNPMIPAEENRPKFLIIRQKAPHAEEQKCLECKAH